LEQLQRDGRYKNLILSLADKAEEVERKIVK
jgi:hypothetical protein